MKRILLFLILVSEISVGQCVNGTSTNPSSPANPAFPNYLNYFNWQNSPTINYNTTYQPNSSTPNPFFSNQSAFQEIALQQDYKTENGWEAIAYNLGYDNNNIVLNAPPQHTYFMLYNKHRGILRILVKWSGVQETFNKAQLTLQFAPGFQTNLLDMTTYEKPLLAPHIPNPKYTTNLTFFNDATNWSYADFKVNYDPCSCTFTDSARLQLYTNLIKNSTINLTGAINGTITSISNGTGTDDSKGIFWNKLDGVGNKIVSTTEKIQGFVDKSETIFNTLKDNGVTINAIKSLGNFMKTNSFMKAGLKALPYVGEAVKFISSLFGGGAGASGPMELAPMSVNLALKINGTVSLNAPMHDFSIGLPGSPSSASLPGIYGGQPLYNEPMGVFSLIDEPTMNYTESFYDKSELRYHRNPNNIKNELRILPATGNPNVFRFTTRNYQMDGSNLRYIINPTSNLELQDAQFIILAEYVKPSLDYKNFPINQSLNQPVNVDPLTVDIDQDNGLSFKLNNDAYNLSLNQNYNIATAGNKIDYQNNLFQSSFPPIGEKYFNNLYNFSFLNDIQRISGVNNDYINYFNFGVQNVRQENPLFAPSFVTPKSEYLAPRVKAFNLKIILNLKRTDNLNAQNVLYVVTYPIKLVKIGGDITQSSYANSAQMYAESTPTTQYPIAGVYPKFVKIQNTTELNSVCTSNEYKANRGANNVLGINENELQTLNNDLVYYPNPVQNKLYFKLNNNKVKSIMSIDGKILSNIELKPSNNINQDGIELDFSNYPIGMYFINYIDDKNNFKTAKIIKN